MLEVHYFNWVIIRLSPKKQPKEVLKIKYCHELKM